MDVGVIGVGSMGRNHVRVYSELKGVRDVYVYDPVPQNAERAKEYAIPCDSLDQLLEKAEAVSICVPTNLHFEIAQEVIKRDIHCLIEKPITLSIEDAESLLKQIQGREIVVGVGHIERFNPIVEEIRRIMEKPLYVEIKRHNPASTRITDSSVVVDLMIHDIDIVYNVLFPNRDDYKIYSAGNRNVCEAMIVFGETVVALSASRLSSKKFRTMYIEDERSTTEGDFMTQEVFIYRKPEKYAKENERYLQENIIEKVLVSKVEPLKVELKAFIDSVKKGEQFPVTPGQALRNLKVCEEIERGLK
jgi:predicted dehydrogenase